MNSLHDFQRQATRRTFFGAIARGLNAVTLTALFCMIISSSTRADRLEDFKKLDDEYKRVEKQYFENRLPKPTTAQKIKEYDEWPGWRYLPRFVALAEEAPQDEAAYRCCQWIFDRDKNISNWDKDIFPADQKAWEIVAAHHVQGDKLPVLCKKAVDYIGPAQEKFLRDLVQKKNLSREHAGCATLALAALLAKRLEFIEVAKSQKLSPSNDEFVQYVLRRRLPKWAPVTSPENANSIKAESIKLFHEVIDHYGDVPCPPNARFLGMKQLGELADKGLHFLHPLELGVPAPSFSGKTLDGKELKLSDNRGRVVLLTFWFSGCGACLEAIPKERQLLDKFKDQPFAVISVCCQTDVELARKTAKDNALDWPSILDGENGPIARDYIIYRFPTTFLLDQQGRIVAKDIDLDQAADKIQQLLNETK